MRMSDLPLEIVKEILDYFPICQECGARAYNGKLSDVSLDFTLKTHNFTSDELDEMFNHSYDEDLDQMVIYDMTDKRVSVCMISYILIDNDGLSIDVKEMYIDMDEVGVCDKCVEELYKVFFKHVHAMYIMKKGIFKWMLFTDFDKTIEGKIGDGFEIIIK